MRMIKPSAKKALLSLIALILTLCMLSSVLVSCTPLHPISKTSFDWFDTVTTVSAYMSQKEFDKMWETLSERLDYYHKLFDIYNEYSGMNNLCSVNKNAGKSALTVDRELVDFISYALEIYEITDKKVNIAMGSLLRVWHEYREAGIGDPENASLPSEALLEEKAAKCDISAVKLDREKCEIYISDEEVSLDVGALAKGYAVEKAAAELKALGYSGIIISAGGNICTVGSKPSGEKWAVGISDPNGGSSYPAIAEISDASLVTSGSYQRYYTVGTERYHHIIDPETYMPANYFVSVTVMADSSALADAMSTALFISDLESGKKMCEELGIEAFWIYADGKTEMTDGFPAK
ncbi:MAG: FAD:protein FMN transferase [Clostridia bacterium]|nr:FAD:protein FMN transferase [Clostridia bacterium]